MTVETNKRGNRIKRNWLSTERYRWDFNEPFRSDGWEQYDTSQDAWYFGVWVNKKRLKILTYAEGDIIMVTCPDAAHFNAEIESMNKFYEEGFIAKAIDPEENKMTIFVQDRNLFFLEGRFCRL